MFVETFTVNSLTYLSLKATEKKLDKRPVTYLLEILLIEGTLTILMEKDINQLNALNICSA